jgi:hypothetical protein
MPLKNSAGEANWSDYSGFGPVGTLKSHDLLSADPVRVAAKRLPREFFNGIQDFR